MSGPNIPVGGDNNETDVSEDELRRQEELNATAFDPNERREAVVAGLTEDDIGLSATSSRDLADPTDLRNMYGELLDAQILASHHDEVRGPYASGNTSDAQMTLYNDAMSGAGDRHAGTIFGNIEATRIREVEEKRRALRERAALYATLKNGSDLQKALNDFKHDYAEDKNEAEDAIDRAQEILDEFQPKIDRLEEEIAELQQRLDGLPEDSPERRAIEIAIDAKTTMLNTHKDAVEGLSSEMREAQDRMERIDSRLALLDEAAERVGGRENLPPELAQRYEELETERARLSGDVDEINRRVEVMSQFNETVLGPMEDMELDQMILSGQITEEQGEEIVRALQVTQDVMKDGYITEEELGQMAQFQHLGNEASQASFAKFVTESGVRVVKDVNDVDEYGNYTNYVSGTEAIQHLASLYEQRNQTAEEKTEVEGARDSVNAEIEQLREQLASADQAIAESEQRVQQAEQELSREQTETAETTADAMDAQVGMMGQSISTFMFSEDMIELARSAGDDESKVLKDSEGNFVYMSADNMELYTLAKDEDGNVRLDENGEQIRVIVSPEETVELASRMVNDREQLPRNFVWDGDDSLGEHSEHDSTAGTFIASNNPFGSGMDAETFEAMLQSKVEEQRLQEAEAAEAREQAMSERDGMSADLEQMRADLASEIGARDGLEALIRQKERELAELDQQIEAAGGEVPAEDANDVEAPTPTYDEEYASLSGQVRNQIEAENITRENLEEILQDAPAEVRAQIERDLERQGVEIEEPEDAPGRTLQTRSNNDMMFTVVPGITSPSQTITPSSAPAVSGPVQPAVEHTSFADSPEFAATNPEYAVGAEPSYLTPVNNGVSDYTPSPTSAFGQGQATAPDAPTTPGPDEAAATLEAQRLAEQDQALRATGGTGTPM